MHELFTDRYCAAFDGTTRTQPFGDEVVVWTVRGHMFAAYTPGGEGLSLRLGTRIDAQRLVGEGRAVSPDYLKGGGWVLFPWEQINPDELRSRINESYRLVLRDYSRPQAT